jgi:hypothetical protein
MPKSSSPVDGVDVEGEPPIDSTEQRMRLAILLRAFGTPACHRVVDSAEPPLPMVVNLALRRRDRRSSAASAASRPWQT